jgi:pyruvate dehydrogenase E1 component alpha subunit
VEVDGNDIFAVYEAAIAAVNRARAGEGPTLIEAVTYRMGFHNTTDNPARYEDPKEREEAAGRDPIDRVVRYLAAIGLWNEERDRALKEEVRAEIDQAIDWAVAQPGVTPEMLFDNAYARVPARVERQRSEHLSALDGVR